MLCDGRLLFFAATLAPVVRCFLHAPHRHWCTKLPARHGNAVNAALTRQQNLSVRHPTVGCHARRSQCFATPECLASPTGARGALSRPPFIAVLRDVCLGDAVEVARALHAGGFDMVSVTADTPGFVQVLQSIADDDFLEGMVLGVSSVTSPEQVELAYASQVEFVSSTCCDPAVVRRTKELGLMSIPGVSTAAQAIAAVEAGGDILKIFPATTLSSAAIQNIARCIPSDVPFVVAGGVEVEQLVAHCDAGASGFAVGRTLFKPGMSLIELQAKARRFVHRGSRLRWTHYGRPREPA